MKKIMIYGATGYTGRLITHKAKENGLELIIAGRNEEKLKQLSELTNYTYRAFPLSNAKNIENAVIDMDYVLNVAGPFIENLPLFVETCIKSKTHFIDLAMDPQILASYDNEARKNGVMLLSGVGHAFLPLDCLGGFLHSKMADATKLIIYISGMNTMSRGTAKSNIALIKYGIHHLKNNHFYKIRNLAHHEKAINNSIKSFIPSSFGVSTLHHSTHIPDIESYFEATPAVKPFIFVIKYLSWLFGTPLLQRFLENRMDSLPEGPTEEERKSGQIVYLAQIENNSGKTLTASLTTPEAYTTTYLTTLKVLDQIDTTTNPGFQTPCMLFGHEIISTITCCKLACNGGL